MSLCSTMFSKLNENLIIVMILIILIIYIIITSILIEHNRIYYNII